MKTRSAKNKGVRLQNIVRDALLENFTTLVSEDVKPAIMGETGRDIKLSPAAMSLIPFSIECKNQEKLNIWSSLTQAEDNAGNLTPALFFKRNRTKVYVAIDMDTFIKLIKK